MQERVSRYSRGCDLHYCWVYTSLVPIPRLGPGNEARYILRELQFRTHYCSLVPRPHSPRGETSLGTYVPQL